MNGHFATTAAAFAADALPDRDGSAEPSLRAFAAFGPNGVSVRPSDGARAGDVGVEAAP